MGSDLRDGPLNDPDPGARSSPTAPPVDATLRLILAQMPAVVWATDADLRFTLSEGGALVELGLGPGEVVGIDQFEYFGTREPTYPPIAAHLEALAGNPQTYELTWGTRTFLCHLEPLRMAGSEVAGVVGVAIDITGRKRAERQLEATVEALRQTEQERRHLQLRLVNAQEEEARRIARDTHDGPLQTMSALSLGLAVLREQLSDPDDVSAVAELEQIANTSVQELRSLLQALVPSNLHEWGLEPAVRELLLTLARDADIRTAFECDVAVQPSPIVAATCFRIVQEALTNVRKHASARRVEVGVHGDADGIDVTVTDDGVGFDTTREQRTGHLGLPGMRERVRLAGGTITISSEDAGTTVRFRLPIAADDEPPARSTG